MNEPETPAANTPYNQIAGQSVERLAAISDGIFAVAMTLLVLDLHDPAGSHSPRARPLARTVCDVPPIHRLPDELPHAGHLLERPAGTVEPFCPDQPAPYLDSYGVPLRCFCHAVFDEVAGGLHRLPDSTPVLLGQHIASRSRPLLELAVCEQNRFGKGRHTCRGAKGSRASHPGGPGALCAGSLTVRG